MKTTLIVGNWKMHKTIGEALELVTAVHHGLQTAGAKIEVVVAPPYTALSKVVEQLRDSFIGVSAQNLFWEEQGAFTGEISAAMIKDTGADYVIIGHSERRQLFHETDNSINKKIKTALKHDLIPIFCVGETLLEREANKVSEVITAQFSNGLEGLSAEMAKVVIAYEPVWAIGTGKTATPQQAEEVHAMLRQLLVQFAPTTAAEVRILYGGSVKPTNSKELFSQPNIDGALIGGASLQADDFINIIKTAI